MEFINDQHKERFQELINRGSSINVDVEIDDPEGEYKELTKMLGGTIIEINPDNKNKPDEENK